MKREKFTEEMAINFFEKLNKEIKENRGIAFSLLYAKLISSDTCIDEDSCQDSLDDLMTMNIALNKAKINEPLKENYKNLIKTGIKIVSRNLENFKYRGYGCC